MVEKIGPVRNPLTIIAIFAGIAEISGTAVLPFVDPSLQSVYIWFLILFPGLLVVLFFLTLNFNHRVLYAPSDFQDENNFLRLFREPTAEDRREKLLEEIQESEEDAGQEDEELKSAEASSQDTNDSIEERYRVQAERDIKSTGLLAEELAFSKIAPEFDEEIKREVVLEVGGRRVMFDGAAYEEGEAYAIEIKYMQNRVRKDIIRRVLDRIEAVTSTKNVGIGNFTLILVLVTEIDVNKAKEKMKSMNEEINSYSFSIDVRLYNMGELEKEVGLID